MGQMKVADELAIAQRNPKNPAVYRLKLVPKVKRVIIRAGYAPIFSNQAGKLFGSISSDVGPDHNFRRVTLRFSPAWYCLCRNSCTVSSGCAGRRPLANRTAVVVRVLVDVGGYFSQKW